MRNLLLSLAFAPLAVPGSAQTKGAPAVHPLSALVQASPRAVRAEMALQLQRLPVRPPFDAAVYAKTAPELAASHATQLEAAKLLSGLLAAPAVLAADAEPIIASLGAEPAARLAVWSAHYGKVGDGKSSRFLERNAVNGLPERVRAVREAAEGAASVAELRDRLDDLFEGPSFSAPANPWDHAKSEQRVAKLRKSAAKIARYVEPNSSEWIERNIDRAVRRMVDYTRKTSRSVKIAWFELGAEKLEDSLHEALERGVSVQLVLKRRPEGATLERVRRLRLSGARVRIGVPDPRRVSTEPPYVIFDNRVSGGFSDGYDDYAGRDGFEEAGEDVKEFSRLMKRSRPLGRL